MGGIGSLEEFVECMLISEEEKSMQLCAACHAQRRVEWPAHRVETGRSRGSELMGHVLYRGTPDKVESGEYG